MGVAAEAELPHSWAFACCRAVLSDRSTCVASLGTVPLGWIVSHDAPTTSSGIVGKREGELSVLASDVDRVGVFILGISRRMKKSLRLRIVD